MFAKIFLLAAIQIGPFFEKRDDYLAVRPFYAKEESVTDIMWPLFTSHENWWRALLFIHYQENPAESSYQFSILPFWFNGKTRNGETYAGLFPFYGEHPHIMLMNDLKFCLWPIWHKYSMPRRGAFEDKVTTQSILFPFISFSDDQSWGVWPFYGIKNRRESIHQYALWPFVTWANYREDRDTSGAGTSWMVWPLCGSIERERENQTLILPPFFSFTEILPKKNTLNSKPYFRIRCPWPFIEYEEMAKRNRLSIWPIYESIKNYTFGDGELTSSTKRFGWKLIELYDDETRVFPFLVTRKDKSYFRLWPFCEIQTDNSQQVKYTRFLSLNPIRHSPQINRNWSKFWTFYECIENPVCSHHSLFWGLIRWNNVK